MKNVTKIFVGVDVSKDTLAVHILPLEKSLSFENNAKGIRKLVAMLKSYAVGQVVCEATGGYETLMLKALKSAGHMTLLVEPKRIKAYIRAHGIRSKTDKMDAQMIALFASQMTDANEQKHERNHELHLLVMRKKTLTNMISQEKNRLRHPQENCKKQIVEHINFMKKQIGVLDEQISTLVAQDNLLSKKISTIQSMPGVGPVTASVLVAEMPELGSLSDKKIAALVGVAPYTCESGLYKGKSVTSGGRKTPRNTLFMAALVAVRFNAKFKSVYERFVSIGKPKKVALVAVMRKIIIVLNAMLRNGTVWNENIV